MIPDDPYLLGFYVGIATATVIELGTMFLVIRLIQSRKQKPRPLRVCKTCDAEVDEIGFARDSLFKLYLCQTCLDTVPRRFAKSDTVLVADVVELKSSLKEMRC